jgi:hypothetical protein
LVSVAEHHHVHSKLTQTAQRDGFNKLRGTQTMTSI